MVAEQETLPRWEQAGPPYELTREEVIEFLHKQGHTITERQIQHWATRGILPAATRKLPRGSTDGKPRAMYPGYMVTVIVDLLEDAARGRRLAELEEAAPRYIEQRRSQAGPDAFPIERVTASLQARWSVEAASTPRQPTAAPSATLTATSGMAASATVAPRISRTFARQVLAYAKRFAEKNGTELKRTTLVVECKDGQRLTLTVDGDETPRSNESA